MSPFLHPLPTYHSICLSLSSEFTLIAANTVEQKFTYLTFWWYALEGISFWERLCDTETFEQINLLWTSGTFCHTFKVGDGSFVGGAMERSLTVCVANLFKFCAWCGANTICLGGGNLGLVVIDFQSDQIAMWMIQINPDRPDQSGPSSLTSCNYQGRSGSRSIWMALIAAPMTVLIKKAIVRI